MVFKAGQSAGKSNSFFFFSHDNKFVIKTMQGDEKKVFLGMLDDYIGHMIYFQNKSLLARIYGIFTIKSDHFTPLDFII